MKKTWYYRMLLSYLPIFFIVTFLLLFLYFLSLSDRNEKQIVETHKLIGLEIMQLVDSNLQAINVMFTRDTLYDKGWNSFLSNAQNDYNKYISYSHIQELLATNRLIESIFLINFKDRIVLGNSKPYTLSEFEKFSYLSQHKLEGNSSKWSRIYTQLKTSNNLSQDPDSPRIISLFKRVGNGGQEGLIIINVDMVMLQELVNGLYSPDLIKVQVLNSEQAVILGNLGDKPNAGSKTENMVVEMKSSVTGWTFQIGYERSWLFGASSVVSNLGLLLAILAVFAGALTIILVTRKHYQPIQQIMSRIFNSPLEGMSINEKDSNELKWIQVTLEKYMDHSQQFQNLYLSEQELRSQYEIREMLEGNRGYDPLVWAALRDRVGLPDEQYLRQCLLIEIDDISSFSQRYATKDQEQLRLIISNIATEMIKIREAAFYMDWITGERLLIVLFPTGQHHSQLVNDLVHSIIDWVESNLPLSITIGVGTAVSDDTKVTNSYLEAKSSLSYKIVLGKNRSLFYSELAIKPMKELHDPIKQIGQIVRSLLQGKTEWEHLLESLLETMKQHLLSREEILSLLQYLIYQIQKDLTLQNEWFDDYWKSELLHPLEEKLQTEETLDELRLHLLQFIRPLCQKVADHHKSAKYYELMHQVKDYIELHYCDDALSLESLSSHFGIGDKYLSKLFKETLGINFGEFVTGLRMDKAKQLLLQTAYSIREVGNQVGYVNALSFARVFKRTYGLTPSELRQRNSL